jgi:hypothetical protein
MVISFSIYFINTHEVNYLALENYDEIKIKVIKTKKHKRGYLIINSKYTITCNHFLINTKIPYNYKFPECICDLQPPYEISHIYKSDTLIVQIDNQRLFYLKHYDFW